MFFFILFFLLQACGLGECDPSLPGAKCAQAAEETGVDSLAEAKECWEGVPFQIKERYVDLATAVLVETDWDEGLNWVDTDKVQVLDASASSNLVTVFTPAEDGCSDSVEDKLYLPAGYEIPEFGEEYNNGLAVVLQPDGTVLEIGYLDTCEDGTWQGYVLPDEEPLHACAVGIDATRWLGAHGGSHFTATQTLREGELTGSAPIGRPLPVEVDHTHFYYSSEEADDRPGYRWPAASADDAAANLYSGTILDLQMGSILVLPQSFDCTGMNTVPSERLCEVARDHGFVVVDDSFGTDEVAFPITPEAQQEVAETLGIDLHNATGEFAKDTEALFASITVLANPEEAWIPAD